MEDSTPRTRVELCVRSLSPRGAHEQQQAVLDRLERLAADGTVDDARVVVWGRGMAPRSGPNIDVTGDPRGRIDTFLAWAEDRGVTLRSFFEDRHVSCGITGEEYDEVVFPAMALAVYRGDDLVMLAPCSDGTGTCSVEDLLAAVERGEAAEASPGDLATTPGTPEVTR